MLSPISFYASPYWHLYELDCRTDLRQAEFDEVYEEEEPAKEIVAKPTPKNRGDNFNKFVNN